MREVGISFQALAPANSILVIPGVTVIEVVITNKD